MIPSHNEPDYYTNVNTVDKVQIILSDLKDELSLCCLTWIVNLYNFIFRRLNKSYFYMEHVADKMSFAMKYMYRNK